MPVEFPTSLQFEFKVKLRTATVLGAVNRDREATPAVVRIMEPSDPPTPRQDRRARPCFSRGSDVQQTALGKQQRLPLPDRPVIAGSTFVILDAVLGEQQPAQERPRRPPFSPPGIRTI